jgi:hypothetical protein
MVAVVNDQHPHQNQTLKKDASFLNIAEHSFHCRSPPSSRRSSKERRRALPRRSSKKRRRALPLSQLKNNLFPSAHRMPAIEDFLNGQFAPFFTTSAAFIFFHILNAHESKIIIIVVMSDKKLVKKAILIHSRTSG